MRRFAHRSTETEWMDTEPVPAEEFARCLGDLATVNRLTLAHRPTLAWLSGATRDVSAFSLLDVGYGHGDMLRAVARWAARHGKRAVLSGVDLDPSSALAARAATPPELAISYHTGDVFDFRPPAPPDFVISSLFTHHLRDAQVIEFLLWMEMVAARGWFVNDLHRHAVAYYGFGVLAALGRWHRFIGHDGRVSIARAFRADDWRRYLARADIAAEVRRKWPFRICVSRIK